MSKGIKHDEGKLDWTLLPFSSLQEVVRVMTHGEKKYERENWKLVEPRERYLRAAFRHLISYKEGEKTDNETGLSHLAHVATNMIFLLWKEMEVEKNDGEGTKCK